MGLLRGAVRAAVDGLGRVVGFFVVAAVVLILTVGSTMAVAWIGITVHDWFWPAKHVDPYTAEICWTDNNGPDGLEVVRGPAYDKPPAPAAIEVPCSS